MYMDINMYMNTLICNFQTFKQFQLEDSFVSMFGGSGLGGWLNTVDKWQKVDFAAGNHHLPPMSNNNYFHCVHVAMTMTVARL